MVVSNGYEQPLVLGQRVRGRRAVSTRQSLSFVLLASRALALLPGLAGVAESRSLGLGALKLCAWASGCKTLASRRRGGPLPQPQLCTTLLVDAAI